MLLGQKCLFLLCWTVEPGIRNLFTVYHDLILWSSSAGALAVGKLKLCTCIRGTWICRHFCGSSQSCSPGLKSRFPTACRRGPCVCLSVDLCSLMRAAMTCWDLASREVSQDLCCLWAWITQLWDAGSLVHRVSVSYMSILDVSSRPSLCLPWCCEPLGD